MRLSRLIGLVSLLICSGPLYAQPAPTSPKVDGFLKSLSTFSTADMARSSLQNLRLTEAENRELEAGLRQPSYKYQIDRLIKTVKPSGIKQTSQPLSPLVLQRQRSTTYTGAGR
jgi:hypothetical protein